MSELTAQVDVKIHDLVINCLNGSSPLIRKAALQEAQKIPKSTSIFDAILEMLDTEKGMVCLIEGFKALKVQGNLDARTQALLSSAMINHRHNGTVAIEAIRTFIGLQGDAAHAVPAIIMLLSGLVEEGLDGGVKNAALNVLREMKAAGNLAAPMLAHYVLNEHEKEEDRSKAVHILRDIGARPEQVSIQLSKALSSASLRLVSSVLLVLPDIGITKDAVPFLVEALNWADPKTKQIRNRYPGMFMMGGIDCHETVINMLATLGPDAKGAVPALEELLGRSIENPQHYEIVASPFQSVGMRRGRRPKAPQEAPVIPIWFTSEAAKAAAEAALAVLRG